VIGLLLTRQVVTYRETRRRTAELQGLLDQVQRQDRENRILLASISSIIDEIHTSKGRLLAANITPILEDGSVSPRLLLLGSDITERRRMEQELAQARKLEAIGQLAAGIAHEINTPTQYVGANLRFMRTHLDGLLSALLGCQELVDAVQAGQPAGDLADRAALLSQEAQLEYLLQEFPSALNQSLDGIQRITHITSAMRTFSRPDTAQKSSADLNQILANTLIVARHQWKSLANLVTDYDPDLPKISCYPAELSQAFLNIITNACDTIADALQDPQRPQPPGGMGTLSLSTRAAGSAAEVRIRDTGMGIPEHIQERIFDPFFTTKDPGKGTGQGLAIAYAIVVKKHGGALSFETQAGQGTTFIIRLPLS
jgi:signal transduction histidine kinase